MQLSFIIPVYNEASSLETLIGQISRLKNAGHEVIVVDGGSTDGSQESLSGVCHKLITSDKGRARQMNAGARHASGESLVFLHADTRLPAQADILIRQALSQHPWGRFDVRLSGRGLLLRLIESMMNLRSRVSGIATGDQCIFISRQLFLDVSGYPDIPLMEDIAISQRLKKISRPACIPTKATTSSRRWESQGVIRTVLLMWLLRLGYALKVSPHRLHRIYYRA